MARREDEIELIIDGRLGPREISISNLAAYMSEFAVMLGVDNSYLFSAIRDGSIRIAARAPKGGHLGMAASHAIKAGQGAGPPEPRKALRALGAMALRDNCRGRIVRNNVTLTHLPRAIEEPTPKLRVRERGHITGEVSGILAERSTGVKVRLRPTDGGSLVYCTASAEIGQRLGACFMKTVRVFGAGWWEKADSGNWYCQNMEIDAFDVIKFTTVRASVEKLREIGEADDFAPFDDFWNAADTA